MNVLVIGSEGFIGNHLCEYLNTRVDRVWRADVRQSDNRKDFFLLDPVNPEFDSLFSSNSYDVCINCSGAASVPDSLKDPLRDYKLNAVNVYIILNSILRHQSECKFVNLSSAAVYGNPAILPVRETTDLNPMSPYGIHKLHAEQICEEFFLFYNVPTCSLRIFSAYGDGLRKQLFWDLYQKTRESSSIQLFGTGRESRDFIYIADLVQAIYLVISSSLFKGDVINVANGWEIYIEDVVPMFLRFFPKKVDFSFNGSVREGDPINWKADNEVIKSLGYKQEYDMEEGLEKYYRWIKNS